jgi:hypothetical protein
MILSLVIQVRPEAVDEQLRLQADIETQRYCAIEDGTSTLLVRFKVRLFNRGTLPIVIYRPIYPLLLVSRTVHASQTGDHEFALHPPDVFGVIKEIGERKGSTLRVPSDQLVIREGETLETSTLETTVPIRGNRRPKAVDLVPGSHFVQVVIEGQIEGTESFVRATSQPVKINILKKPELQNCQ